MSRHRDLALLGVVLGTVLLSGAVFAFPNGFIPEYHYEVERVTADDEASVYGWVPEDPEVRDCRGEDGSLTCRFERTVREEGTVIRDERVRYSYELVLFGNGEDRAAYYRVNGTELANGSFTHTLEPVEPREALSVASLDADNLHPDFQRLLDRGEIRSTSALPGWEAWWYSEYHLAESDGEYFRQVGYSHNWSYPTEQLIRALVGFVGLYVLVKSVLHLR